jgi:hypothetical protein
MPAETSVAGFIQSMNTAKTAIEIDVIKQALDLAQSKSHDSISEVIDLVFAITGYGKAEIPGGEVHVAGECIAKLMKYLTLRAKEDKATNESPLPDTLLDLIRESTRLYAELQINRGVKVVSTGGVKQ